MSLSFYTAPGVREIDRLPAILSPQRQEMEARNILKTVAKFHQLTVEELCSRNRKTHIATARQQYCYLVWKKVKGITLNKIAEIINTANTTEKLPIKYDHSDVIHCRDKVKGQLNSKFDNEYKTYIQNLLLIL